MDDLDSTRNPPHGFIRSVDPAAARHQLRMSVGVAVVLALATFACLLALDPARAAVTAMPNVFTHVVGPLR